MADNKTEIRETIKIMMRTYNPRFRKQRKKVCVHYVMIKTLY